jgi:hypothetical protein
MFYYYSIRNISYAEYQMYVRFSITYVNRKPRSCGAFSSAILVIYSRDKMLLLKLHNEKIYEFKNQ